MQTQRTNWTEQNLYWTIEQNCTLNKKLKSWIPKKETSTLTLSSRASRRNQEYFSRNEKIEKIAER